MAKKNGLGQRGAGPVECLGMTFESEDARRKHFIELLAKKLRDPEFRAMPGFPDGSDEAILRMSDPPYYTACPNPFLADFVRVYGKPYDPAAKTLISRMMAYYVKRGMRVPLSAQEFSQGVAQRHEERDGMYFLPDQAAEYDRLRKGK